MAPSEMSRGREPFRALWRHTLLWCVLTPTGATKTNRQQHGREFRFHEDLDTTD